MTTSRADENGLSWDAALIDGQTDTSLVGIARDRRLVLQDNQGSRHVDLCWVDEVALALIDLARSRGRSLDLVYPAPAGQVAVLLAAQLLLRQFLLSQAASGGPPASLGLVTADPAMAERTWRELRIATVGERVALDEVLACHRAGPDGESPVGGRRFTGIIIGRACAGWPVIDLVVDHLAGPVRVPDHAATVEVFADPLDPALSQAETKGQLIWGWSDSDVARCHAALEVRRDHTVSFSVATDRLDVIAHGVKVTVRTSRHPSAETAVARVREDLRLLRAMSPGHSDRNVERGLSIAWHHLATLTSLPTTPDGFDRFASVPPMAARATRTFERELASWSATLSDELAEITGVLASDIGDLRAELQKGNPFKAELARAADGDLDTLVVTRTRTASRALLDELGADPDAQGFGRLTVCAVGRLHRQGTWPRVMVVGEPPPWDWHRILSGLSTNVEVLVLGEEAANSSVSRIAATRSAGERWGGTDVRARTWRALVGSEPPPLPAFAENAVASVTLLDGAEYHPEPDPFDELSSLFNLDPIDFGGEGPRSGAAREDQDGEWDAEVDAVEVSTDHGSILLETGRSVEVRSGAKIEDRRPEQLREGDVLLVGRQQGRVGLIEALEERLGDRPDLLAARMLVDSYRRTVRGRFVASGITVAALHRAMADLGCDKTSAAVRDWVTDGTMAPQQFSDLAILNECLDLGMSEARLRELFTGVQRRRGFRRAAGRALAAAARSSTLVEDDTQIDAASGVSIADLRDAVIEAIVITVSPCGRPMPLTLLGRLEEP